MESGVSVMPNLNLEIGTDSPSAEAERLLNPPANGTNADGMTEAVQKVIFTDKYNYLLRLCNLSIKYQLVEDAGKI